MVPLFRFFVGGRLGSGRQWMSWMTLDDEVGAIRFLFEPDDLSGPVNVTGPTPVTNALFTRGAGRGDEPPDRAPCRPSVPSCSAELADELLFASLRAVPTVLTSAGFDFAHRDVVATALQAVLGTGIVSRPEPGAASGRPVVAAFDFDGTLTQRDTLVPFLRRACGDWPIVRAAIAARACPGARRLQGGARGRAVPGMPRPSASTPWGAPTCPRWSPPCVPRPWSGWTGTEIGATPS